MQLDFRLQCCLAYVGEKFDKEKWAADLINKHGMQVLSLQTLLANSPGMMPVPASCIGDLQTHAGCIASLEQVMACTSSADIEACKERWAGQRTALKALERSVVAATKDSKRYVAQLESAKKRQEKNNMKQKEKEQQDLQRASADQRARQHLMKKQEGLGKPVYAALASLPEDAVKPFIAWDNSSEAPDACAKPWYVSAENEVMTAWSGDDKILEVSKSWVAKYKTFSEFIQKGRTSAAMESGDKRPGGCAREASTNMFAYFHAGERLLDLASEVPTWHLVNDTCWLTGYGSDMEWCGVHPNGAVTMKVALLGRVTIYSMSLASLIDSLRAAGQINAWGVP